MTKSVFIVGGDVTIRSMFIAEGWKISDNAAEADLLQFTGGEDVTPTYYNEAIHPYTGCNPNRDNIERKFYLDAIADERPMAGICRGGQFLNVMSGGKLFQHVNNHTRYHRATVVSTGVTMPVSSTHHQMMRAGAGGVIIMTARESTVKEHMVDKKVRILTGEDLGDDLEVIRYGRVLCFQPHPEYLNKGDACWDFYFNCVEEIL